MHKCMHFSSALALLAVTQFASAAEFSFIDPTEWSRGETGSLYFAWDAFDITSGSSVASAPDAGTVNLDTVTLDDLNDAGFATGGGNWYGFNGDMDFTMTVTGDSNGPVSSGADLTAYLQLSVLGEYQNSFLLNGVAGNVSVLDTSVNSFGSANYHLLIDWTVAANDSFVFNFGTSGAHVSLDALAVDIGASPVPVPAAAWLFGSALLGLTSLRKKASR